MGASHDRWFRRYGPDCSVCLPAGPCLQRARPLSYRRRWISAWVGIAIRSGPLGAFAVPVLLQFIGRSGIETLVLLQSGVLSVCLALPSQPKGSAGLSSGGCSGQALQPTLQRQRPATAGAESNPRKLLIMQILICFASASRNGFDHIL